MFGPLKLPGNILIGAVVILLWGSLNLVRGLQRLDAGAAYATVQLQIWQAAWVLIFGSFLLLVTVIVVIIRHYMKK